MEEILGVTPSTGIPKPIGGRIIIVDITTTLSVEEKWKKAGLHYVASDKSRPRNSCGIVVAISIDPLIQENFKLGMMVYFGPLSGTQVIKLGKEYRILDFGEIISTDEETEVPEPYKQQVRDFLTQEPKLTDVET